MDSEEFIASSEGDSEDNSIQQPDSRSTHYLAINTKSVGKQIQKVRSLQINSQTIEREHCSRKETQIGTTYAKPHVIQETRQALNID